jgi:hypothetical protein
LLPLVLVLAGVLEEGFLVCALFYLVVAEKRHVRVATLCGGVVERMSNSE